MKICPACQRENTDNAAFCAQCGAVLPAGDAAAPPPGAYVAPPAPPRRRLSPWAWVGIGCGLLTLLTVGGCVAFLSIARTRITQEMNKPFNEREVLASLKGIPLYPGARLDPQLTKGLRATFGIVGGMSAGKIRFDAGAFRAPGTPDKIISWYDSKLKAAGWKGAAKPPSGFNNQQQGITDQRQYVKGTQQLVVQVGQRDRQSGNGSGDSAGGNGSGSNSLLILTQVSGLPAGS